MGKGDDADLGITPKTKVNEVMQIYPETTDYFLGLGLCNCGFNGGFGKLSMLKTIEDVAKEKNIPPEELIKKIKELIKD